jgi:hypothetical protein
MRLSLCLFAFASVIIMSIALPSPARAGGTPCPPGTTEGTVQLEPAVATVPYANRTHDVTVRLAGLDHQGVVGYDDDLDGVDERCVESDGLGGFELTLAFNSAAVAVEGIVESDALDSSGSNRRFQCQEVPVEGEGRFSFGCISTGQDDGPQGSFDLATITLRLVGGGPANLELAAVLTGPLGDDATVDVKHGTSITVTGAPVRPTIQPGGGLPTTPPGVTPGDPANNGTPATAVDPTVSGTAGAQETSETPDGTPASGTPSPDDEDGNTGGGGSGSEDGTSAASVMLWTLAGLAGFGAAGALGFFALRWRGML